MSKHPFVRLGDRILSIPYEYLQDMEKLQSLICEELLPLFYLLDHLSKDGDFEEMVGDFSWREKIGRVFTKNLPKYL